MRSLASFIVLLCSVPSCVLLGPGASKHDDSDVSGSGSVFTPDFDAEISDPTSTGNKSTLDAAVQTDAMPACQTTFGATWTINSAPQLSAGKLPLTSIDTPTVRLGTGGCLKEVSFTATLANDRDCALDVAAGPYIDKQGRLIVSRLSLRGSGTCPGFPAAARGTFYAIDSASSISSGDASATLAYTGDVCTTDSTFLAMYCHTGTLDLALHGSVLDEYAALYSDTGDDAGVAALDLEGAHLKLHMVDCSFDTGSEQCPVVATP